MCACCLLLLGHQEATRTKYGRTCLRLKCHQPTAGEQHLNRPFRHAYEIRILFPGSSSIALAPCCNENGKAFYKHILSPKHHRSASIPQTSRNMPHSSQTKPTIPQGETFFSPNRLTISHIQKLQTPTPARTSLTLPNRCQGSSMKGSKSPLCWTMKSTHSSLMRASSTAKLKHETTADYAECDFSLSL